MNRVTEAEIQSDVAAVGRIAAVPSILDVVCRMTGMGFAAVARVTGERWIACCVQDDIAFGLVPGGELKLESTICHEIRGHREPVVIDCVAEDPLYRGGEGEPPESPEEARGVGAKVIGELRERRDNRS